MATLSELISENSKLSNDEAEHLAQLVAEWRLLADLSFADLILWLPIRKDEKSWPEGSKLELNYLEIALKIFQMVVDGNFPIRNSLYSSESAPRVGDGLIRLDTNGVVFFASPNARSALSRVGFESELEGKNLGEVFSNLSKEDNQPTDESWQTSLSGKFLRRAEYESAAAVIDLLVIPLTQKEDRIGAIVLLHNVTELRNRDRALVTKDATIKEIHHRVKNNLQTVSALLRLQSRRVSDPMASAALNEAVRRVASIALVHESLSNQSSELLEFDQVFEQIVKNALDLNPRKIQFKKVGDFGSFDSKTATALSLVVTELIHNAIEHGLSQSGDLLSVEILKNGNDYKVSVSDNGVGLPDDFNIEKSANLGLQIANTLTKNELNGSIRLVRLDNLTKGEISFKVN